MQQPFLTDLALTRRALGELSMNREAVDLRPFEADLALYSDKKNLIQAIHNRLHTRLGELTLLGHPSYGSRLYLLQGEPITWRTKALAQLYIGESLAAEKRITEVHEIQLFETEDRATLGVRLMLAAAQSPIDFSFSLELAG